MSLILANMFGEFQWLIVALIVLLLFGNRLPSVMRSMGQGVSEFKKGIAGIDDDEEPRKEQPPALDQKRTVNEVRPPAVERSSTQERAV
jgi:sec-independent protein translocase protein TatA